MQSTASLGIISKSYISDLQRGIRQAANAVHREHLVLGMIQIQFEEQVFQHISSDVPALVLTLCVSLVAQALFLVWCDR